MAGRNSLVKNVYTYPKFSRDNGAFENAKPQDRIRGNGGGKWFAYDGIAGKDGIINPQSRKLLVENTVEPINFYNMSQEDGLAAAADGVNGFQGEFKNAKNIAVYGTKNENCNPYGFTGGSENIFFFGAGKMNGSFVVNNANNLLFKTFSPQRQGCALGQFSTIYALIERNNGNIVVRKDGASPLAYYRKGTPDRTRTLIPVGNGQGTPTPTSINPTITNTPIPTVTNTPIPTATNTPTPTLTNTPVPTFTNTPTPTNTTIPTPTPTFIVKILPIHSPTVLPTVIRTPTSTQSVVNLLTNTSFEQPLENTYIAYGQARFDNVSNVTRSGNKSLLIFSQDTRLSQKSYWTNKSKVPVSTNDVLNSSVWVRGSNLTGEVELALLFYNKNNEYLTTRFSTRLKEGTTQWKELRIDTVRSPTGSAYAVLEVRLYGAGRIWIDDISLQKKTR